MGYIFICPKCGATYECTDMDGKKCSTCGIDTVCSGYSSEKWNALSKEERIKIKEGILGREAQDVAVTKIERKNHYEASTWIGVYRLISIIASIAIVIMGFVLGFNSYRDEIIYIVGGCVIGAVYLVGNMTLCEFLENTNKIRYEAGEIKEILEKNEKR